MTQRIEDYALIGDLQTAALVGRNGSVDWLCLPRFDSAACFATLLGDEENGHWRLAPEGADNCTSRSYRGDSLVLESVWETRSGNIKVTDFMPQRDQAPDVVRIVEGLTGEVTVHSTLRLRFDYGHVVPWVRRTDGHRVAVAGPDAVWLRDDARAAGDTGEGCGSTDGGSTDGGSTEAGATDSGSTEAGATDSGSTEAGATGSGSTEAGATGSGATEAKAWEKGSTGGERGPVPVVRTWGQQYSTRSSFTVRPGERVAFVLTWHPSNEERPPLIDPYESLAHSLEDWADWAAKCTYEGPYRDAVLRSLITLKALTYAPTGGIAAAPTTSLPEEIGGVRNWDYRYCWLRDSTLTLGSLLSAGYLDEAAQWRDWLLRAVAGDPADLKIMYGLSGERRLPELELPWLKGYEGSAPVRIGNDAAEQLQLDVYGEVIDSLYVAREAGLAPQDHAWNLQLSLLGFLESMWREPDDGLWEVRGPRRHFVHSKVMAWVAADRAVRTLEEDPSMRGDAARWRAMRDEVHREVCEKGYDAERNTFTQSYGSAELDAATLLIPIVGFLPPDDPRVVGTVEAVRGELGRDGDFIRRYSADETTEGNRVDGLPGGEGSFLVCSFWLADALLLTGRVKEARELFEKLLSLRNDVGLLAEEYDPVAGRQLGNFPQAFSHVGLVGTAQALAREEAARGAAEERESAG